MICNKWIYKNFLPLISEFPYEEVVSTEKKTIKFYELNYLTTDSTLNFNLKGDIHPRVFDPEVSCFNAMATLWLSLVNVESPLRFSVVNVETPIRWSAVESPVRPSGALVDISLWMSTGKVESVLSDGVLGFGPWSDVSWISSSWGLNKMSKEWDLKKLDSRSRFIHYFLKYFMVP